MSPGAVTDGVTLFLSQKVMTFSHRPQKWCSLPTLSAFHVSKWSFVQCSLSIQPQKFFYRLSLECHPLDGVIQGGVPLAHLLVTPLQFFNGGVKFHEKYTRIAEISTQVIERLLFMFTLYTIILHQYILTVDNYFTWIWKRYVDFSIDTYGMYKYIYCVCRNVRYWNWRRYGDLLRTCDDGTHVLANFCSPQNNNHINNIHTTEPHEIRTGTHKWRRHQGCQSEGWVEVSKGAVAHPQCGSPGHTYIKFLKI